jgi:thioredoxin
MATKKLTNTEFIELVFDYTKEKEWKFKGNKPAIIDFYANWCAPCKMVAPILEQLSDEYKDKIDIYKVNTEQERELSAVFGIMSIPSFLFIPMEGMPSLEPGSFPKQAFKEIIEEHLLQPANDEINDAGV